MSHPPWGAPLGNHSNLSPRCFDSHSPSHLSVGLLPTNLEVRHMSLYIPLDMCFVSQFARCFYVSFRELRLSCSIFEKIDPSRVSFPSWCHVGRSSWSKSLRQWRWSNQHSYGVHPGSRRLCWSCVPFVFSPHVLNLGTRFLFSGGELSQP